MATDTKTGQQIFHGSTASGLRNVGSYQVSGHPYITGNAFSAANVHHHIEFPYVTKEVTVIASGSFTNNTHIRVHFGTSSAENRVYAGHHYVTLNSAEDSIDFDVKCKEMWISSSPGMAAGGYEVVASLTTIPTQSMFALSGSGINA